MEDTSEADVLTGLRRIRRLRWAVIVAIPAWGLLPLVAMLTLPPIVFIGVFCVLMTFALALYLSYYHAQCPRCGGFFFLPSKADAARWTYRARSRILFASQCVHCRQPLDPRSPGRARRS